MDLIDNEIMLLEMGKPVKITELARNMIELSGLSPGEDVEIEYIVADLEEDAGEDCLGDRGD